MMDFNTYRLLNETLGSFSLGVRSPQVLGLSSNKPIGESDLPQELLARSGKKRISPIGVTDDSMEPEEDMDDEDIGDEEMGDEEIEDDDLGDDEDDEDAELDHEDDLEGDEEGNEDDLHPTLKKPVMPFMKKGLKTEDCGEDHDEEDEDNKDDEDGEMVDDEKADKGPVFMMKKAKKCDDGMSKKGCKKCKKMKESTGYERPASYDNSDDAWLKSAQKQMACYAMRQKQHDGMRDFKNEDLLLTPQTDQIIVTPTAKPEDLPNAAQNLGFSEEEIKNMVYIANMNNN